MPVLRLSAGDPYRLCLHGEIDDAVLYSEPTPFKCGPVGIELRGILAKEPPVVRFQDQSGRSRTVLDVDKHTFLLRSEPYKVN